MKWMLAIAALWLFVVSVIALMAERDLQDTWKSLRKSVGRVLRRLTRPFRTERRRGPYRVGPFARGPNDPFYKAFHERAQVPLPPLPRYRKPRSRILSDAHEERLLRLRAADGALDPFDARTP